MAHRIRILTLSFLIVGLFVSSAMAANMLHRGMVIAATPGRLTITDESLIGHQHSYRIDPGARITLNGDPVQLTQLERGDRVVVVMTNDRVSAVHAIRRFPPQ